MAVKSKITKTEFDALSDEMKGNYKEEGEFYILDSDERRELLAARNREKERGDRALADIATLRGEFETLQGELEAERDKKAKEKNDIPTIEAAWQKKLDDQKKKSDEALARRDKQLSNLLVRNVALQIANEVSDNPDLLLPHLERSIVADLDGEEPKTVFLDDKGQRTAKNLEDFKKEVVDNPTFASIIIGSKATGGGADQRKANGGGAPKSLKDMTETERVELAKRNPEAFRNLAKAAGAPLR